VCVLVYTCVGAVVCVGLIACASAICTGELGLLKTKLHMPAGNALAWHYIIVDAAVELHTNCVAYYHC